MVGGARARYHDVGAGQPAYEHVYAKASRNLPDRRYTVTATTFWHLTWAVGGLSDTYDTTREASAAVQIDELQVVTN